MPMQSQAIAYGSTLQDVAQSTAAKNRQTTVQATRKDAADLSHACTAAYKRVPRSTTMPTLK